MSNKTLAERVVDLEDAIIKIHSFIEWFDERTEAYDELVEARKKMLKKMRIARLAKARKKVLG